MELGERIRELRAKNRLSQGDLAKAVESATSTISEIERGERSPRVELLIKIADYFGISTDDLLGRGVEDNVKELKGLIAEVEIVKRDYEDMTLELKDIINRYTNLGQELPVLILGEKPNEVDEETRKRLEAEYGLEVGGSRLEEKYVNMIFKFLLLIKRMEEEDEKERKEGEKGAGAGEKRNG